MTGPFDAALLESTLNGTNGYRINPSVVSGPYRLVSFDGTTAELERNDYFKGNADLELPLIEKLTYTLADNDDMEAKLVSGEFDILNKVTKAEVITAGMGEIAGGEIAMSNYPRSGLAYVVFCCEKDTVSSEAVRQAITWCMDRDAVMRDYTGNFGLRVDSYFGVGQWMYAIVNGTTAPPVDPPENEFDAERVREGTGSLGRAVAGQSDRLRAGYGKGSTAAGCRRLDAQCRRPAGEVDQRRADGSGFDDALSGGKPDCRSV